VLEPLKELDEVAYLRFASVYKNFGSVSDFADEIAGLMAASADQELAEHTGGRGGSEATLETTTPQDK
jgi:transcriptional repressor NrdR